MDIKDVHKGMKVYVNGSPHIIGEVVELYKDTSIVSAVWSNTISQAYYAKDLSPVVKTATSVPRAQPQETVVVDRSTYTFFSSTPNNHCPCNIPRHSCTYHKV